MVDKPENEEKRPALQALASFLQDILLRLLRAAGWRCLHDFYLPALRLAVSYDAGGGFIFAHLPLAAASPGFSAIVGTGKAGCVLIVWRRSADPRMYRPNPGRRCRNGWPRS